MEIKVTFFFFLPVMDREFILRILFCLRLHFFSTFIKIFIKKIQICYPIYIYIYMQCAHIS